MIDTKADQIRTAANRGDWKTAILIAAKFAHHLGKYRNPILSAREAYLRPEFQIQIKKNPNSLIEAGKIAIKERYL